LALLPATPLTKNEQIRETQMRKQPK